MQQSQLQHESITIAIDEILTKGSHRLYDSYIKEKLPKHANQICSSIIDGCVGVAYKSTNQAGNIRTQKQGNSGLRENNIPNRVSKQMQIQKNKIEGNLSERKLERDRQDRLANKSGIMTQRVTNRPSSKVRQKLQINLHALTNPQISSHIQNEQFRKQRNVRFRQAQKEAQNQKQQKSKIEARGRLLQAHIQQLQVQGIPYNYDNDGNITSPQLKQFKNLQYEKARAQKRRQGRIFSIKMGKTIDVCQHDNNDDDKEQRYRKVIGRKRGYFSTQLYRKLKMTNQEYNNQNSRQNSTIPYLTLSQGVKVIQRARNIIAQKNRKNIVNLSQYKHKTQTNFFKSYIPQYQQPSDLMLQTMSFSGGEDRPYTSAQFNRTKRTSQTGVSDKMMNTSILWRPRTSEETQRGNKFNKIRVDNQELARRVVKVEE